MMHDAMLGWVVLMRLLLGEGIVRVVGWLRSSSSSMGMSLRIDGTSMLVGGGVDRGW